MLSAGLNCGSSSVDRASAFQAEGREFEPRLPLKTKVSCDAQTYGEKGLGGNAKLLIFKEKRVLHHSRFCSVEGY